MGLFDTLKTPVFLKEDSDAMSYIEKLKELQSRAKGELRKKIDKEIKIAEIGIKGEDNIAFELKNSNMPMYVLRDIHLEIDGLTAQIDYIVVTRKLNFIIECKNLIGNIEITNQGDFIRHYELYGKKVSEGVYSPVTQNQRHMDVLKRIRVESRTNMFTKFLSENFFEDVHKSIIVLANPKTILNARYAKKEIKDLVIRADQLVTYIKKCCDASNEYSSGDNELKTRAERILSFHVPNSTDYSKKYEEILNELNNEEDNQTIEVKEEVAPLEIAENDTQAEVDNNTGVLEDKLKAYRLQKSREQNVKPYFIFNNNQMMELIEKMPKSKEELIKVSGFGEVKAEKYGEDIIRILYGE